jgi:hypothetical protein
MTPLVIETQSEALFSQNGENRRELRRWWGEPPLRWAAWLMLNPSNANKERDDPTTKLVTHFTREWGYDGWIVVNLYPFISSIPSRMWQWAAWDKNGPDWLARDAMSLNLADIERVGRMASIRIVAFGAEAGRRAQPWVEQCLEAFSQPAEDSEDDERLWCLGKTIDGSPLHPMARGKNRVPRTAVPSLWKKRELSI